MTAIFRVVISRSDDDGVVNEEFPAESVEQILRCKPDGVHVEAVLVREMELHSVSDENVWLELLTLLGNLDDAISIGSTESEQGSSVTSPNQAVVVEGFTALKKALTVTQIRASKAACDCPHCGEESYGWLADPRGRETTCDECGQPFIIAADATVSIT